MTPRLCTILTFATSLIVGTTLIFGVTSKFHHNPHLWYDPSPLV